MERLLLNTGHDDISVEHSANRQNDLDNRTLAAADTDADAYAPESDRMQEPMHWKSTLVGFENADAKFKFGMGAHVGLHPLDEPKGQRQGSLNGRGIGRAMVFADADANCLRKLQ